MVTFAITVVELVMLVLQVIHFLQRPSDNKRLQYLILLLLLITYNIIGGLFPDRDIPISFALQTIIAYFVPFVMSVYAAYYYYKVFELHSLKFYATYGALLFLFLPFILLFVIPYLLTGDALLSSRMVVVIPFFYGLGYIYYTARSFIRKFSEQRKQGKALDRSLYHNAIAAYIFAVCWASLPLVVVFGNFQVLAHSVTNAGFLVMTVVYVRSNIIQSRHEYERLLESERNLKHLNSVLKRKVRRRTRKLETLMKERQTTFINLAHETKTPLTLINNYLDDYIKRQGVNEELSIIKNNINRLTKDIVNLFDFESFEKGFNIYDHNQLSNVSDVLALKRPLFQSYAAGKGITLSYLIAPLLHTKAHPGAIDRITNNLIENAIKYSTVGDEVEVKLASTDGDIVFSVKDTGPGIPRDMQEKVFQPYFKLSISGAMKEGLGMGLSIVRKIVQDLNGEIRLNSAETGTEISVVLPMESSRDKECSEYQPASDSVVINAIALEESFLGCERPQVLLVEDNEEMLKFLVDKLKEKFNVVFARSGAEAIQRMEELAELDLIISDVMMPDMDGFAFCTTVLATEKYAHIPFIFLTAKATAEDKIKGLGLGAVDYVEKPFKVNELVEKVDSLLLNLKKQRAAVVTRAYHNILSETSIAFRPSEPRRKPLFYDNCKKYHLSAREVQIVRLLMKGQPYKVIGDQLHISDKTVGKHVSNIFGKAGVNNKVELMNRLEAMVNIDSDYPLFY